MNDDLRHQATRLANDAEKYLKAMHKDKCDPDSWYSIRAETAIAGVRRALAKAPATVSEGEEQGFGAPATKELPSSPSLERVAVLEEALRGALDFYETEGQGESDPEWVTVARGLLGGNDG